MKRAESPSHQAALVLFEFRRELTLKDCLIGGKEGVGESKEEFFLPHLLNFICQRFFGLIFVFLLNRVFFFFLLLFRHLIVLFLLEHFFPFFSLVLGIHCLRSIEGSG